MRFPLITTFRPRHRQILSMIGENWSRFGRALFCMLITAGTQVYVTYLIKDVIDEIFINKDLFMLKMIPVIVIGVYLLRGLGMYWQEYFMAGVGQDIIRRLRNRLYERIQDLPLSFFQTETTGALMSRTINDVNIIRNMVSNSVTGALRDCITIAGLTGVIFYRDWKLAGIALLVLPVAFFPIVKIGARVRGLSKACQEAIAGMSTFLHETISGNKIVKAFGMEPYEKKRFRGKTENIYQLEMKTTIARALTSPLMEFLGGIGIAFIIWYGGYRVIAGSATPGTFFSFIAAVLMLYAPVKKLTRLNNQVQEGLAATDRIFDIIETRSDITDPADPVPMAQGAHSVTFDRLYFKYEDEYVLKNINYHANPGDVVALVGMSGGGKTSLVNLIPRFYNAAKGSVLIDGTDVRQFNVADLRRQIAIVTQQPILFNDTIYNNIAYGNPDAGEDEVIAAAKAAYAYHFISRFPLGFKTNAGELGDRLSGGEKQRICIARALLKNAPILIMDEATSSLDTESEMLVQKALENLMRGRTTFVIAHRLSTITHADHLVVLVGGEITEQGTHEELIEKKGEYYKLYQMQFRNSNGAKPQHRMPAPKGIGITKRKNTSIFRGKCSNHGKPN